MLPGNTISLASVHQPVFLSPFWLRTKISEHQIQQVWQHRHQETLSLAAEVISLNSAFTFLASFPAWLLKLPVATELGCDETGKFFSKPRKNEFWQLRARTQQDSLRFSLVKPNTMYSQQACQGTHGTATHREGGRPNGGHFLSVRYHDTTFKSTVCIKYIFHSG